MEDKNNIKFGPGEGKDEKDMKGWKKLDDTFKQIILFAMTEDGESSAATPTERFQTLLNAKMEPLWQDSSKTGTSWTSLCKQVWPPTSKRAAY